MKKAVIVILMVLLVPIIGICQNPPNIILILTDDQPYGYMGCTGNDIVKTPNLDKLAADGILFTNAHITSAICTPSRASILLSQFERKHGVNFNSGTSVSEEAWAASYPVLMRSYGYYTGWIGKNHVPIGKGGYESGLMEKSFDYWYAGHGHLSFYPKERHGIFENARSDTQVEVIQEGVEDFLDTNESRLEGAIHFLEERPKDKPFMLSINFNLPHSAGTSTMQLRETDDQIYKTLYRDVSLPLPRNYIAKKDITTPKLPPGLLKVANRQTSYDFVDTPDGLKERFTRQLQSISGIDRLVGNLRRRIKEQGLSENTVILFTSDHGLFMGEYGLGGKALCYEKTTHVPLIIMDPTLNKSRVGLKSDALVQSIDIAPTMLKIAGIPLPDAFQGKDISGVLKGTKSEVRSYIFTENLWSTHFGNPRIEAVQNKEWKYLRYYKNNNLPVQKKITYAKQLGVDPKNILYAVSDIDMMVYRDYIESPIAGEKPVYEELFNLKNDPNESTNLITNKDLKAVYNQLLVAWKQQIIEARGIKNPMVVRYTNQSQWEAGKAIVPE